MSIMGHRGSVCGREESFLLKSLSFSRHECSLSQWKDRWGTETKVWEEAEADTLNLTGISAVKGQLQGEEAENLPVRAIGSWEKALE